MIFVVEQMQRRCTRPSAATREAAMVN